MVGSALALLLGGCPNGPTNGPTTTPNPGPAPAACDLCADGYDVVRMYRIPGSETDCPGTPIFVDVSGQPDQAGLVDFDGTQIIDRNGNPIEQYCLSKCPTGEEPINERLKVDWNNGNEFLVVAQNCRAEQD